MNWIDYSYYSDSCFKYTDFDYCITILVMDITTIVLLLYNIIC